MWFDILKINIKNIADAKRVAQSYLPEELYNNMLISEEEYQKLPRPEQYRLHTKLVNFLNTTVGRENLPEELKERLTFHRKMQNRLRSTKPEQYTSIQPNTQSMLDLSGIKYPKTRASLKMPRVSLIDNYFQMYRNQGKGIPTLEDIKREEGRPLTIDEEEAYYRRLN
tara:strand:+ start:1816 stop:2319 length:504 start_codon:yes stop_codon:yes gene_type:complete